MSPSTTDPASPAAGPRARRRTTRTARERGQVLVIFAGAMIALVALCAVVVDVAWYWTSNLRMQRAADAAALAGVVWLPGNQGKATIVARDEAAKNGYTNGVDGVVVTPSYDAKNPRRIKVAITGPVGTLFARAVGINSWPAARDGEGRLRAARPDGQPPELLRRRLLRGLVSHTSVATGHTSCDAPSWDPACAGNLATAAPSGGQWTPTSGTIQASVNANNNVYATENTNGEKQQLSTFGLLSGGSAIPTPGTGQALTINGIEVRLSDAFVSATCNNSTIGVQLSWDAGTTWSTAVPTGNLGTNTSTGDYMLGQQLDDQRLGGARLGSERLQRRELPRAPDRQQGLRHVEHDPQPRPARAAGRLDDDDDDHDQGGPPGARPGHGLGARPPGLLGRDVHLGRLSRERRQVRPALSRQRHRASRPARTARPTTRAATTTRSSCRAATATCACSTRCSAPRATTGTAARSAPAITGPAAPPRPASRRWPSPTRCTTRRRPCSTPPTTRRSPR